MPECSSSCTRHAFYFLLALAFHIHSKSILWLFPIVAILLYLYIGLVNRKPAPERVYVTYVFETVLAFLKRFQKPV